MKTVSILQILFLIGSLKIQLQSTSSGSGSNSYMGSQPPAYGPNFPQIQGVNSNGIGGNNGNNQGQGSAANPSIQNRLANTPNTAGPIFPNCSSIDSIGSPVLLIYQAEQMINGLIDPKNSNSFVNFLYYNVQPVVNNALYTAYQLVFSLMDYSGTYYAGINFRVGKSGTSDQNYFQSGVGDAEMDQFILSQSLATVNATLGIPAGSGTPNIIDCGDLKFIFSSFGNSGGSAVPGSYPGANNNGVLPALVQQFKAKEDSFSQKNADVFTTMLYSTVLNTNPPIYTGWMLYLQKVLSDLASN